jgi:hypothetical protein
MTVLSTERTSCFSQSHSKSLTPLKLVQTEKIAIRVIWGVKNVDFPCVGTLARAQHDYIQSTNQPLLMRHLIKRLHNSVGGVQN